MSSAPQPAPAAKPTRHGVGDKVRTWWESLSRMQQWGYGVFLWVALAALPVLNPPILTTAPATDFGAVMAQFAMYALIAIGLNVVVGQAGLLDLGYIGFYALGAYSVAVMTSKDGPLSWDLAKMADTSGVPQPLLWCGVVAIAVAFTAIMGLFIGSPTLRLRGDYLAIVTLGFGEIIRLLADNLQGITKGGQGLSNVAFPSVGADAATNNAGIFSASNAIGTFNSGVWWYWAGLGCIIVALILVGNLERSRVGRAWVAIREDEDAAEIMGVPTFKFKLWAFVIGAGIGGLSGALYAGQVQFVVPTNFNVVNSVLFLCAVVLGGQGNKLGVILGAFIIVYLPNRVLGIQVDGTSLADYKYLFFGLALMVLMIFRPQGLLPVRQKLLAAGQQVYNLTRRNAKAAETTAAKGAAK